MSHPFLNAKTASRNPHEPGQLADADDVLVGDVGDEGTAHERQGMMLAERGEWDRPLDDLR